MDPHLLRLFTSLGIILVDDHFVLQSGKHSDCYINKSMISVHPEALKIVGYELAKLASTIVSSFSYYDQVALVAPAAGAIPLGCVAAQHLLPRLNLENREGTVKLLSLFAEKVEGANKEKTFELKRGYDKLINGLPIVIIEDILTTGGSAKLVVEAVRAAGGKVLGVVVIWNRGNVTKAQLGDVPHLFSLVEQPVQSFPGDDCPLCRKGVPINTQYGHGQAFLASRQSA
jgi:orotate phosphoribosyltransferase